MRKVLFTFLFFGMGLISIAQSAKVTGKITSADDGSALPGVSVLLKGSSTGAQSDADGNYSIIAPKGSVLEFSFIGFIKKSVTVGSESVLNVALSSDERLLQEVVVTGLGRQKEEKAVGTAMQTVKSDKLTFAKETNVASALSGKIAGVKLQGAPSTSFREPNLLIRGATGLSVYANPLYVLDGTPVSLSAVNMDNIEAISVLKGAAATAIYGQRGSEGVVVLTSKKAKRGKIQIDVNSATTFSKVYNLPPYQNEYAGGYSQDWSTFEYNPAIHPTDWAAFDGQKMIEYYADESWGPKIDGTMYRPYYSWIRTHPGYGKEVPLTAQPNNVKDFFETGVDLNNNITIGGGSENGTYRLSYTNIDRSLPVPNTKLSRNFITLNTSYDLTKKITASANINYLIEGQNGRPLEGYGQGLSGSFNQWFQRQVDINILKDYKNPDGTFNSWNIKGPEDLKPLYWDNPYTDVNENLYKHGQDRVYGDLSLKYKISDKFNVQGWVRNSSNYFNSNFRISSGTLNQSAFFNSTDKAIEMNYEFLADYKDKIGELFTIDLSVGGNVRDNKRYTTAQSTSGGLTIPGLYNISASKDRPIVGYGYSAKKVRSIYGLASLGFKGFLYLDATLRNDWSSALPVENNSYMYPSVAGSFVFSEFLKNQNVLSFGKLKASWASVGSDTDPYRTSPVYPSGAQGSYTVQNLPTQLPNTTLKPTLSKSYDLGLEMRFLKDKIGFDFNYYTRENTNQILPLTVPSTSGYNTALVNAGNITNDGYELAITLKPIKTNDFDWEINFNAAKANTIVKELAPGITNYVLPTFAAYSVGTNVSGGVNSFGPTVNARVGEKFGLLVVVVPSEDSRL
jgi:TonB-linked SusC/RagA family outer membrane protein